MKDIGVDEIQADQVPIKMPFTIHRLVHRRLPGTSAYTDSSGILLEEG